VNAAAGLSARLADGSRRLRDSVPAILQVTITAVAAYAFAVYVLGHDEPLIATIAAITALGFVRDARPVRVLETVIAMPRCSSSPPAPACCNTGPRSR